MQALNDEDEDGSKYRRLKYRMLISRDFLLIFLLVQVTICSVSIASSCVLLALDSRTLQEWLVVIIVM